LGERRYSEPAYNFLDTSALPSVCRLSDFFEGWFAQYGDAHKAQVAGRFQARDDHKHVSAVLELINFAVLKTAGFAVTVEPPVGSYAPDFEASRADVPAFFVECTATGMAASRAGEDRRQAEVLDMIDELPTGRYLLQVEFEASGAEAPSVKRLRSALLDWLASLDFGAVVDEFRRSTDLPEFVWSERGWTARFSAIPAEIPPESPDDEGAIGMIGPEVRTNEEHLRIRRAVDVKASKYGTLGQPLLVAVTSLEYQRDEHLITALIGDKLWTIHHESKEVTESRESNGVFYNRKGPRNVNLSAVTHGRLNAFNFASDDVKLTLTHHPYAANPLPRGLFPFCQERYFDDEGNGVTIEPLLTVAEFFGLPAGWPHFDLDPR